MSSSVSHMPSASSASFAQTTRTSTPSHSSRPSISTTPTTATAQSALAPAFRYPSSRRTIYDRNPNRSAATSLSRASFAFLFSALVQYAHTRAPSIADFEARLARLGYPLGLKLLDLLLYRATPAGSLSSSSSTSSSAAAAAPVRPLRLLQLLTLISTKLYPLLFARPADSLEQSTTSPLEYHVIDNTPLTNMHISPPKELSQLSVAAYIAGIIEGVCDGAGFAAKVSAHNAGTDVWPSRTVFLIKFDESVGQREAELERMGVK